MIEGAYAARVPAVPLGSGWTDLRRRFGSRRVAGEALNHWTRQWQTVTTQAPSRPAGTALSSADGSGLGRNVMDVGSTGPSSPSLGCVFITSHLALGGVDLTSSSGKLTMNVLNAVAEFERDLLIERTQAGLSRAIAEGKTLGRPQSLTDDQRRAVEQRLEEGATVSALARAFKTSRNTIMPVRDAISAP